MNTCTVACSVGKFGFQDLAGFLGEFFLGCGEKVAVAMPLPLGVKVEKEWPRTSKD